MSQPASGQVLTGRYRLEQRIARGGMATVWLGYDELLGRRVAVKTLHPELAHDDALGGRFRQEAVAAAALSHPNIVATYDTGEDDGTAFIVMELVEGESLRQVLDRKGVLDPPEACAIAHQVASALDTAHRQGIIHRDIKPANVLVAHDGRVKVTDFGIAKATGGGDYTRTGTVVGTARYLSPEQVQGQPTDARSDVYALGLVLYEMLAGRPAYSGDTEMATALARLTGPPTPIGQLRPHITPALASVLDQALQPDPAHRIPSAAALSEALRRAESGVVAPARVSTGAAVASTTTGSPARAHAPTNPTSTSRPAVARPAARPTPVRKRRRVGRVFGFVLFLLFLAALGVAAGLVTAELVGDSGGSGSSGASAPPSVANVRDFDPLGDGTENGSAVGLAIDGLPETAWTSETYVTRDLGGGKEGVGLALTLDAPTTVSQVQITGTPGADVEIFVADRPADSLAGWGASRARRTDIGSDEIVTLDQPVRVGAILVWFTRTPQSGRIAVQELRVG